MSSEDEPEPPEKTDICSKRQPKKKTYEDIVSGKDLIVLDRISRNKLNAEILLKFENRRQRHRRRYRQIVAHTRLVDRENSLEMMPETEISRDLDSDRTRCYLL